jgi:flavorubredoxin
LIFKKINLALCLKSGFSILENIRCLLSNNSSLRKHQIYNISKIDKNDLITEIFKSKGIAVGSPTINQGILTSVAGILEEIKGLKFTGKKVKRRSFIELVPR